MNFQYTNNTLKNKFGIKDTATLNEIEVNYTALRLRELARDPLPGKYDFNHLRDMHKYIFQDVYTWAGKKRNVEIVKGERLLDGESVDYTGYRSIRLHASRILSRMNRIAWVRMSWDAQNREFAKCFAALWSVHPFRDGNTRTIVTFCQQFADAHGMQMDREMFKVFNKVVRDSLVLASSASNPDYSRLTSFIAAARERAGHEPSEPSEPEAPSGDDKCDKNHCNGDNCVAAM